MFPERCQAVDGELNFFRDQVYLLAQTDALGQVLTATDSGAGTITRTYDILNRLITESTPQGAISYTSDALGRRQMMQVSGLPPMTYQFDAASRLTQVAQGGRAAAFGFDAADRRTSLTLPNGSTISYSYDAASRLAGLTYGVPSGPLGTLTYSYDAAGNRIAVGGTWARNAGRNAGRC